MMVVTMTRRHRACDVRCSSARRPAGGGLEQGAGVGVGSGMALAGWPYPHTTHTPQETWPAIRGVTRRLCLMHSIIRALSA